MCRILLLKMVHVQFNFDSLFTLKNDYKCIKRKYPDFTKMFLYTFTKKMECGNVVPLLWLSLVTCKFLLWTCEHLFESEPVAAPPNRVGWWPRVDCLPPPPPKKKNIPPAATGLNYFSPTSLCECKEDKATSWATTKENWSNTDPLLILNLMPAYRCHRIFITRTTQAGTPPCFSHPLYVNGQTHIRLHSQT